jgi:RNA polymerase sigma-70 factor (ECF subfamily)
MSSDHPSSTHSTLLLRLRQDPTNQSAWGEFVEIYGRQIFRWCRQWRLQTADAEDVTQQILLKLSRKLREFTYDPSRSFRGWLKTVAQHAWRDFIDGAGRSSRVRASAADGVREMLSSLEAREDLIKRLEDAFDHEILEAAKIRVRLRVAPHTWEAFQLVALDGVSAEEAAAKVNMQVAMVYVAKSKVQKMLQEEIRKLEGEP